MSSRPISFSILLVFLYVFVVLHQNAVGVNMSHETRAPRTLRQLMWRCLVHVDPSDTSQAVNGEVRGAAMFKGNGQNVVHVPFL